MARTKKKKWESHLVYAPSVSSWMDFGTSYRPSSWDILASHILQDRLKDQYPGASIEIGEEYEFGEKNAAQNWSYHYEIIKLPADWHCDINDLDDLYGDVFGETDTAFGWEKWKQRAEEYEQSLRNTMTQFSKEEALASLVQIRQELSKEARDSELQWDWIIARDNIVSEIQGELILQNVRKI